MLVLLINQLHAVNRFPHSISNPWDCRCWVTKVPARMPSGSEQQHGISISHHFVENLRKRQCQGKGLILKTWNPPWDQVFQVIPNLQALLTFSLEALWPAALAFSSNMLHRTWEENVVVDLRAYKHYEETFFWTKDQVKPGRKFNIAKHRVFPCYVGKAE